MSATSAQLESASRELTRALSGLRFRKPVTHVYNPLEYAYPSWKRYVERFGQGERELVLVGMNPGPFGMVQTGVPFGEIAAVRDWMGIEEPVGRPPHEHPKRKVQGFACLRSEVSGRRLWGWAKGRFGEANRFFRHFFVLNYCPLAFMDQGGRNITPDKLAASEREKLYRLCDEALRESIEALSPQWVIGIGLFAEARAREALGRTGKDLRIGRIPHPSPASPAANRGWEALIERELKSQGIDLGRFR